MTQDLALGSQGGWSTRAPSFGAASPGFRFRGLAWALAGVVGIVAAALLIAVGLLESAQPTRAALAAELARPGAPPDLVAFYGARGDQPLWFRSRGLWPFWTRASLRPEAAQMAAMVADAAAGEVSRSTADRLAATLRDAGTGRPPAVAKAEVALSAALGDYAAGQRNASAVGSLAFVDPEFGAPASVREVLQRAAEAPSLADHLKAVGAINPIYGALRQGLAAYRRDWAGLPQVAIPAGPTLQPGASGDRVARLRQRLGLGAGVDVFDGRLAAAVGRFQQAHGLAPTGRADPATIDALNAGAARYERLIRMNLERARLLPPPAGERFILVNPAAGQLWLYEGGKPVQSMRVVVGARETQTPMMAGLMRYLVFNPYWEVPPDLVRSSVAPKVLARGLGAFRAEHLQALPDWSDEAVPLDPAAIDWAAVAAGRQDLHVRQQPGGDNMMGAVKFMLPNELGIYLHDTPNKAAFRAPQRLLSAGCVRLERAGDLVAWLLGHPMGDAASLGVDDRIDLQQAVPVYITYLTAAPGPNGVVFHPDVYNRDPAALAALDGGARTLGAGHVRGR